MVPIPVHVINFSLEMEHIVKVGKKQILSLAIACFYLFVPGRGEKTH
jgi:LEA14-like dessication related protein